MKHRLLFLTALALFSSFPGISYAHADVYKDCTSPDSGILPLDIATMTLLYHCTGQTQARDNQILCVFRDKEGGIYAQNNNLTTHTWDTLDTMRFEPKQISEFFWTTTAKWSDHTKNGFWVNNSDQVLKIHHRTSNISAELTESHYVKWNPKAYGYRPVEDRSVTFEYSCQQVAKQ